MVFKDEHYAAEDSACTVTPRGAASKAGADRQVKRPSGSLRMGLHKGTDQRIISPVFFFFSGCLAFIWWRVIRIPSPRQRVTSRDIKQHESVTVCVVSEPP